MNQRALEVSPNSPLLFHEMPFLGSSHLDRIGKNAYYKTGMDKLLESLSLAGKHLSLLDKMFKENYPPYAEITEKLLRLPLYDELRKEVYAGGKKRGIHGYGRQMILGDLLQYIFTGRGYYFAIRGDAQREAFITTVMYVCNQLILMEDVSVDVSLRNKMLDTLRQGIGAAFFEDYDQEWLFGQLRQYEGKITPSQGREHDNTLDSMLPKRVGAVPELLVYASLIRKNYGYVVPLLHAQRLLGNAGVSRGYIVPPDFLLLRSKGETFGIEVGRGKERQIGSFSTVTSIPVFTAGIGSSEQPQPYRCARCRRWIIYCDEVIHLCAKNEERGEEYDCAQCPLYEGLDEAIERCPHIVYHGRASGDSRELRYHYNCVKTDPGVQSTLSARRKTRLIAPIPWVSGLEHLPPDA